MSAAWRWTLTLMSAAYFPQTRRVYQLLLVHFSLKSQVPYKEWYIVEIWTLDSPWPQKRIDEPQKNNRQHRHLSLTCPWFLDQNQSIAGRSPRWKFQFHVLSESYKNGRDWFAFSDGHCSLYTTHSSDLGVALLFLRKLAPLGQRFCSKW